MDAPCAFFHLLFTVRLLNHVRKVLKLKLKYIVLLLQTTREISRKMTFQKQKSCNVLLDDLLDNSKCLQHFHLPTQTPTKI